MADSGGRQFEEQVNRRSGADDRAVTPSVGKALEGGIVVLFVGLLTTMLLGGLVPDYRAATGAELGDRVLATASQEVERAVPSTVRAVDARRSVDLPSSIAGEGYEIRTDGRWLVLDHPDPAVGGRVRLVLPATVDSVDGVWQSGADTAVTVEGNRTGLVVELTDGGG
ncbi:hypothetical protein BRC78_07825 [Halobacteriales archaeon QH_8_68_33]|nr:MAG: hypothetical protein BRC78_07825 [Halobacteriales archaeon QH_8_68_33]